jgi:hypothetical protein
VSSRSRPNARGNSFIAAQLTFADLIASAFVESFGSLNFAYCAAPIGGTAPLQGGPDRFLNGKLHTKHGVIS